VGVGLFKRFSVEIKQRELPLIKQITNLQEGKGVTRSWYCCVLVALQFVVSIA
jgi:hypothetical protein